jgi:hypothetical protein
MREEAMHQSPTTLRQLLRDVIIGAILLIGLGLAISLGSTALELIAMR